jgi:hypothetical protein
MPLHLIKLAVGAESFADMEAWQAQRLQELVQQGKKPEMIHITRSTPKRAAEVLNGGSLYWVIKGVICARQRLLELRPIVYNDAPHCGLVYDKELIRVVPRPHRPFQGWRYLDPKDAPPDLATLGEAENDKMLRELAELGLL